MIFDVVYFITLLTGRFPLTFQKRREIRQEIYEIRFTIGNIDETDTCPWSR